jgi:hypothetical protein
LTAFVNEACDHTMIRGRFSRPDPLSYPLQDEMMDITRYFKRPKQIATGSYNAAGLLTSFNLTIPAFYNAFLDNWPRTQGAYGFTCTTVFTLAMVSSPFQAGRVKLVSQPILQQTQSYNRLNSLPAVSQLPGVELDLAEKTSAILSVPYCLPQTFIPLQNTTLCIGSVGLFGYTSPAIGAGDTYPNYIIYVHLEDFKLYGATAVNVTFQSGSKIKDESSRVPGSLSQALSAGSGIVSYIGNSLPAISSYTSPVAWFVRQASNVASALGWSKPLNFSAVSRMNPGISTYQFNADGADTYYTAGAFADNQVAPTTLAHTDVDEMSFSFITSIYSAITTLSYSTGSSGRLYTLALCPNSFYYYAGLASQGARTAATVEGTQNAYWPSSIFWLSQNFYNYRGGFRVRIKLSKTKLHTGRILLGFIPADCTNASVVPGSVPTFSFPAGYNFPSAIWDIREQNVFDFDCPFISQDSYLPINVPYGSFFMQVLAPLGGPPSVATSVPFVVEVSAMPDFELAIPASSNWFPAPYFGTTIVSHSGTTIKTTGDSTHSLLCIGERIHSIKQLLNISTVEDFVICTYTNLCNTYFGTPWYRFTPISWSSTPNVPYDTVSTYTSYLSAAYALGRGGTMYDMTAIPNGLTTQFPSFWAHSVPDPGAGLSQTYNYRSPVPVEQGYAHFKFPYYRPVPRDYVNPEPGEPLNSNRLSIGWTAFVGAVSVSSRAADDAQLGLWLGPPPLAAFSPPNRADGTTWGDFFGYTGLT